MKKIICKKSIFVIPIIILFSISCSQNGGKKVETWYDSNNTLIKELYYTKTEPPYELQGSYKRWNKYKNLIEDLNYKNNKLEGTCLYYQDDGKRLIKKEIYSEGMLNGTCEYFQEDGTHYSIVEYKNDKKNGNYKLFYKNSILYVECNYLNDLKHGVYKEYYENSKLKSSMSYYNDLLEGEYVQYSLNGNLQFKGNYKNDKRNGIASDYYENGKIQTETSYVLDVPDGMCKEYNEEGQLFAESQFKNGKANGPAKIYFSDGSIRMDLNYLEGKLNGMKRTFYPNGKIAGITEMKDDYVNGSRILTSKTGKFNAKGIYQYDSLIQSEFVKINNVVSTQHYACMSGFKTRPIKIISDNNQNINISFEIERKFEYYETDDSIRINVIMNENIYCRPQIGNIIKFYFPNEVSTQYNFEYNKFNSSYCVSMSYKDFYLYFANKLIGITIQCYNDQVKGQLSMVHTFSPDRVDKKLNKFENYKINQATSEEFYNLALTMKD